MYRVIVALIVMVPMTASAQFLMDGASIQDPMLESGGASFIFEGGIAPIETHGASQNFLLHPIAAKSYCGDGVRDAGESCDGNNLASATCLTRGYRAGTLTCSTTCTFNEAACTAATSSTSAQGGTSNTEPRRSSAGRSSVDSASSIASVRSSRTYLPFSRSSLSLASNASFSSVFSRRIPFIQAFSSSQQSHTSTAFSRGTSLAVQGDTLHESAPLMSWNWRWIPLLMIDLMLLIYMLLAAWGRDNVASIVSMSLSKKHGWKLILKNAEDEEDDSDE